MDSSVVHGSGEPPSFGVLCKVLQDIQLTKTKNEKLLVWKTLTENIRNDKSLLYEVIRIVAPKLDSNRKSYGIKENSLAQKYVSTLCLSKTSAEAKRLLKYKNTSGLKDFPDVLYHIIKDRCSGSKVYSIAKINSLLDLLAKDTQNHNTKVSEVVNEITREMRPEEQKWFCRIILKELRLGLSEKYLLYCLNPKIEAAFNVCTDLFKIIHNLDDIESLFADVSLGNVFKPMLADRISDLSTVELLMKNEPFFVETKYDGERMQIHKDGSSYLYFSRGYREYSSTYGSSKDSGSLTPHIYSNIIADSCILDGEIIVYDVLNDALFTKAQGIDARNLFENSSKFLPCFVAFDIVYHNGKSLTATTFAERRKLLETTVREKHGYLQLSRQSRHETQPEVLAALNDVIERGDEGLILKKSDSLYVPDQRSNGGWYKIKPDYLDGLADSIDVVIIGGYFGKGRLVGKVANYLCALRTDNGTYTSFCKVATGISKDETDQKLSKLETRFRPWNGVAPAQVQLSGKEKPDVVIDPKNSMVLEIRAAELMGSTYFGTSITARFPRVVRVRDDKTPEDSTTVEELSNMKTSNKRGIAKIDTKLAISPRKALRRQGDNRGAAGVVKHLPKSDKLKGRMYCVLSGSDVITKERAVEFIKEHGGDIACTPVPDCTVVCGRRSISVQNVLALKQHLVIDIEWVGLCGSVPRPCPPYLILFCPTRLKTEVEIHFDEFGDSYAEPTSVEELRRVFEKMETMVGREGYEMDITAMNTIKARYHGDIWRFLLKDYVILCTDVTVNLRRCEFHGARLVTSLENPLSDMATHRVIGSFPSRTELPVVEEEDLIEILKANTGGT